MEKLFEMIQDATGPSRELDCRIWSALLSKLDYNIALLVVPNHGDWQAPFYTASIDDAMSLVRTTKPWQLILSAQGYHQFSYSTKFIFSEAKGATAPLAICAAAIWAEIRAQQSMETV